VKVRALICHDDGQLHRVESAIAAIESSQPCYRQGRLALLEALRIERASLLRYTKHHGGQTDRNDAGAGAPDIARRDPGAGLGGKRLSGFAIVANQRPGSFGEARIDMIDPSDIARAGNGLICVKALFQPKPYVVMFI
jgi:hypothetical protein